MAETRANGESQREREAIREREAELRRREFDALVAKAGIDDAELARLKVLAQLTAEAYSERIGELLDAEEGSTTRRVRASVSGARESDDSQRRRLRI